MENDIFGHIIGQEAIKRNLKFRLEGYQANGFIQPIIFEGSWGGGKTSFMRALAKSLISPTTKEQKPYFELNGANLKNIGSLVNSVISPNQNSEYTLGVDEVQSVAMPVQNWLLSVLQASDDHTSTTSFDGQDYCFDFKQQTFLFATTNGEKLSDAFKSRCLRLVLEPYSFGDIQKILDMSADKKQIKLECSAEVSKYCRGVPRQAKNQFNNILQFTEVHNLSSFNLENWNLLRRELGIMPLGLLPLEYKALELLFQNQTEGMTLTFLANKLRCDVQTIRRDIEKYLLEQGLIKIDVKRYITKLGVEVFKECVEFRNQI